MGGSWGALESLRGPWEVLRSPKRYPWTPLGRPGGAWGVLGGPWGFLGVPGPPQGIPGMPLGVPGVPWASLGLLRDSVLGAPEASLETRWALLGRSLGALRRFLMGPLRGPWEPIKIWAGQQPGSNRTSGQSIIWKLIASTTSERRLRALDPTRPGPIGLANLVDSFIHSLAHEFIN